MRHSVKIVQHFQCTHYNFYPSDFIVSGMKKFITFAVAGPGYPRGEVPTLKVRSLTYYLAKFSLKNARK